MYNSNTPLVTVRCITYNHANYISDALDGFLLQVTTFPFEVIVHDDASTDGTTDIIRMYAEKYPNIIVPILQTEKQYSKNNGGLRRAINHRIRGKYVALCEGDDYWIDENKLEKQICYMEENHDCTMTIHAENYEREGIVIKIDRISLSERDISAEEIIEGGGEFCSTLSICCKTNVWLDYPQWRLMPGAGDYKCQILCAINGRVHYFPEIMGVYRTMVEGSWSQKQKDVSTSSRTRIDEIAWLTKLNFETENKYLRSINRRIGRQAIVLFKTGEFSFYQTVKYIWNVDWLKRYRFFLSIIKNYPNNFRKRKLYKNNGAK